MPPPITNPPTFRFLDLPAELRLWVYDYVALPTTWKVLDRGQARMHKSHWPAPPQQQVWESRMTLITPYSPLSILTTCRQIHQEASPIFDRKMRYHMTRPVRFLVDHSAAWALVGKYSGLSPCIGLPCVNDWAIRGKRAAISFVKMSKIQLAHSRRRENGSVGAQSIELTIAHQNGFVCGPELLQTIIRLKRVNARLKQLKDGYSPTRLVVVYKSPLPLMRWKWDDTDVVQMRKLGKDLLEKIPTESTTNEEGELECGVFRRPLGEEAFDKHVESLEWY